VCYFMVASKHVTTTCPNLTKRPTVNIFTSLQVVIDGLLAHEPRRNNLRIAVWQSLHHISVLFPQQLIEIALTCPPRKPATPFSRSIHQKELISPIHQIVLAPRPDGPASMVRKPAYVHPCGGLPGWG
jgi:hypothetical protein